MAATVYGTGTFGVTAETGMTIQSFTSSFSIEEVTFGDEDGDDVSGAFFNPKVDFEMSGFESSAADLTAGLGATITLANDPDYAEFDVATGGKAVVKSGRRSRENRAFGGLDAGGTYFPSLGTLQP